MNAQIRQWAASIAALRNRYLFPVFFVAVALSHFTLLRLPYYWDEGGYYIPAALDFYHRYTLIPEFTNAHPPLPNVVLGLAWHVFGYHILVTRLVVSAFAAAGLLAVFRLARSLLNPLPAIAVTLLTAVYPIWFAQSTLAHADIFAAAFTLWAFAFYIGQRLCESKGETTQTHYVAIATLFSLAALSKETAILEPAALGALHLWLLAREHGSSANRRNDTRWLMTFAAPLLPLLAWYIYHRAKTGFTFGNAEYLRYNATANFTLGHVMTAFRYRFVHLAWQRNIWFPLVLSAACLVFLKRENPRSCVLPRFAVQFVVILLVANWIAFSILGGALLTRYLLPVYPLTILVCVAIWRATTARWAYLAALSAVAFVTALWWSPPAAYAPEDNLTYRDMIEVHQRAIAFIDQHYPDARVLTSWPAAAELYRPDLGYTDRKIMGPQIDDFSSAQIDKAAQEEDTFDTALVFSKNFVPPALTRYLLAHPASRRAQAFEHDRDLSPREIAKRLGGIVVFNTQQGGEWAAVLRFKRRYDAQLLFPEDFSNK